MDRQVVSIRFPWRLPVQHPDWFYDDLRQVGLDFEDPQQVATYDARQGGSGAADAALLARLGVTPDTVMADLGCGTGILAIEAARIGARVHAVDVSREMLRAVQARAQGLPRLTCQHAGFLSFEVEPASLDLITTKNALHHLPDFWKAVALVRMRQALKPGGRLYIRDVAFGCAPSEIAATVEGWIAWMTANTGYSREEVAAHVREEHSTFTWVLERLVEEAGFRLVQRDYDMGVYAAYLAEAVG
jgi:putative AdoMet-dependent methyltransferase